MSRWRWVVTAGIGLSLTLMGCGSRPQVRVSKDAPLSHIHRVVVFPFTDDPAAPASGLRAAAFFNRAAQVQLKDIQWIGPTQVLKQQGIDVGTVLREDSPVDAAVAIEPVVAKVMESTQTVQAVNPARYLEIAKHFQADAWVSGSVFYERGTGMVESVVTKSRKPAVALALHMADTVAGREFLGFQAQPEENDDRHTQNQLLQDAAQEAAERIQKEWK